MPSGNTRVRPHPHLRQTFRSAGVMVDGSRTNRISSFVRTTSRSRSYKACCALTPTMLCTVFFPTIIMLWDLHNKAESEWGEGTRRTPFSFAKWTATSSFVSGPCCQRTSRMARRIRLFVALMVTLTFALNIIVPNLHRSYHISAFMSCGIGCPSKWGCCP